MSDLVIRLRHQVTVGTGQVTPLRLEAADRIEELEAKLAAVDLRLTYKTRRPWRFLLQRSRAIRIPTLLFILILPKK